MTETPSTPSRWRHSRYAFAAFFLFSLLGVFSLLRLVLLLAYARHLPVTFGQRIEALLIGVEQDLVVGMLLLCPLLLWFLVVRNRWFGQRWHKILLGVGFFLFWGVEIFTIFAGFFFFQEFNSRFNTVAVDYLVYPHEVFINIWDSYPVAKVIIACGLLSLIWLVAALWYFRPMWARPVSLQRRFAWFGAGIVVTAALLPTVHLDGIHFTQQRVLNQVAEDDAVAFVSAAWTHNLDFHAFYKTIPMKEAYARVRKMLTVPRATFIGKGESLLRQIKGDPKRPRLNVVILIEESLGSEFWGSLGRKGKTLTPNMDRLAETQGLLFTNIYATGNRTIRGFEGVLSSFPPLPGGSIVHRDHTKNVETLARVLKRDGYNTVFLYGGRGMFDSMEPYALNNGYDRFIEEKDFQHPTFATVWGVCDEDLYAKSIKEFDTLDAKGKPFFGTLMSVSNHKPYTYPPGRIKPNPYPPSRDKAVQYADYALGQFFKAAEKQPFWTNTIFVVVADHGARVYGSQDIPIRSYEIPVVILGPAVVKHPERLGMLGCQMDVSPTILGLIGRPYKTLFFGRDLLHDPPSGERAFINHNRDIGMFTHDRLVVLGLEKTVEFYSGDPKHSGLKPLLHPSPSDIQLERNAISMFQVADDMYMHEKYHIDPH